MKSFREYMKEETMPYANVRSGEMDVENSAVRDQINQLLAGATSSKFITPYVALERVAKTLANFHIFIPNQHFLEGDSGTLMWPVSQYGNKIGMTDQGEFVVSGGTEKDETHGPHMGGEGAYIASAPEDNEYIIYFEYRQSDCGMFMVFCEIVTKEELSEILDDLEAELEDDEGDDADDDEEGLVVAEEVYHPSYTSAIQTAVAAAKKRGYEVDQDDYQNKVASGPRKPSEGKTVSHNIKLTKDGKPTKKGLAIQVYNRGGDKTPYELNHYISEEKDEPPFEPTGSTTNAKTPRNVAKRLAQKAMKQAMKDKADTKK